MNCFSVYSENMNVLISNKLSINILIQLKLQFCIWARGIDPSTSKHFLVAGNSIWVCSSVESAHFTLGDWSDLSPSLKYSSYTWQPRKGSSSSLSKHHRQNYGAESITAKVNEHPARTTHQHTQKDSHQWWELGKYTCDIHYYNNKNKFNFIIILNNSWLEEKTILWAEMKIDRGGSARNHIDRAIFIIILNISILLFMIWNKYHYQGVFTPWCKCQSDRSSQLPFFVF